VHVLLQGAWWMAEESGQGRVDPLGLPALQPGVQDCLHQDLRGR